MASSTCEHGHSAFCTAVNCLDDLILLSASYISLIVLSVAHFGRQSYGYHFFGFQILAPYNGTHAKNHRARYGSLYLTDSSGSIITETIGLLIDLGLAAALLARGQDCPLAFASVFMTIYLLVLLIGRINKVDYGLRSHSAALYALRWLFLVINTWTLSFGNPGAFDLVSVLTRFAVFTGLCILHGFAMRNSPQTHGYETAELSKEETASLFSRLTFHWMSQLVWKAYRRPLEVYDLYSLSRDQMTSTIASELQEMAQSSGSLIATILNCVKSDFLIQGAWAFAASISALLPPLLIQSILEFVEDAEQAMTNTSVWFCVGGLLVSGFITATADCQANWIWRKIGAKARSVLLSQIYTKLLRKGIPRSAKLQNGKRDPATETEAEIQSNVNQQCDGNVLNMISVDVEVISNTIGSLYLVWVTFPVQMTLGTYLLHRILGKAGIVGVVFMLALLPVNFVVSKKLMNVQAAVLTATDARLQASNEVLSNIRNIKFSAWELAFGESVLARRDTELKKMRWRFIWWSISMTLFYALPVMMTAFTLFFFTVVWSNKLGTDVAFPALAMFTVMRIPVNRMADSVNFWLQAFVSLKRIGKLLGETDTTRPFQVVWTDTESIGFENATLAWPSERSQQANSNERHIELQDNSSNFMLKNLQVSFCKGALNIILGPSGSGKSSILLALLGEMQLCSGRVCFPLTDAGTMNQDLHSLSQSTAYCPQEPWILNRSIRDNILLGQNFDATRYERAVYAVSLMPDLASLDHGDQTICGENGDKLSGGQKQRVAIARALYSHSTYVLLDDCLSAVDSRSAHHIFSNAILGPLMRGRTCILATHHAKLTVPHSQHIVILDGEGVKAQGTPNELVSAGLLDYRFLKGKDNFQASWDDIPIGSLSSDSPINGKYEHASPTRTEEAIPKAEGTDEEIGQGRPASPYGESKPEGFVPWSTIRFWLRSMGAEWYWVIVMLGFVLQQSAGLSITLWLKQWTKNYDLLEFGVHPNKQTHTMPNVYYEHESNQPYRPQTAVADGYYLIIYMLINLAHSILSFCRDMVVFYGALRASRRIYKRLLNSVMGSTLQFFDRVPTGQITNRFSRDIEVIDQSLPTFCLSAFQLAMSLALIVLFISYFVPEFVVAAIFIFFGYYWVCSVYLHAARDLKRIEAVERSPLYQQFGETIAGCVSIRAYGLTSMFKSQNHQLVDRINSPYLLQFSSKEWLGYRIGILSSLILFFAGTFLVWRGHSMTPGIAGIILTYAASFTETMSWLVQIYAFIQQDFNSIERVSEYIGIQQEASRPLKAIDEPLPSVWPEKGRINFNNYTVRYALDLEPALKHITLELAPGKRVAIVGRTGAGKSTLGLALIRGLEADAGSIEIDGIDIASISLKQLRKAVTLVPQDPKLFSGTVRHNLSPLYRPDDDRMLDVLRAVQMFGSSPSAPEITYSDLDRPANSLSRGQRQLLCMARGLLRRSRILILDEATANVDHEGDEKVQAGLRASLAAGTTVLTVAHRLNTIADYDHVVVLDSGYVVEQGSPVDLLERRGENARFWRMCMDSGDLDAIEKVARGTGHPPEG